jgi:hypothetical protein
MRPIRFSLIAILLLAICNCANPLWTISDTLADNVTHMAIIVGLGTLVGIAIAVLSYYAAIIMNDERNKVGAISEIKSTLINLLLFAFVMGAIVSIDRFFGVLALDPSANNIAAAITNLYGENIDYLMPVAKQMVGVYSDASQVSASSSSISGYVDIWAGIRITTNVGRVSTITILENLANALSQATVTVVSICGQQAMMANIMGYFVTASCQLLLPFGFFLRAIPYVRRAGSTLVAIGITLTLIYPIALFFLGSIMFGVQHAAIDATFSNGFNPGEGTLASTLSMWSDNIIGMAISYEIVGNLLIFMNVFVKGISAMIATALIPFFGLGFLLGAAFKNIFMIANLIMTYGATGAIFTWHQLLINNINSFFLNKGGMEAAVDLEYDIAIFGTIVNMTHILLIAGVVLTVVGSIRSLAILLGGEFFLYGLQEYI